MKTSELLKKFKQNDAPPPTKLWERLVWMAANLIKSAEMERHTYRKPKGKRQEDDRQMDLFNQHE